MATTFNNVIVNDTLQSVTLNSINLNTSSMNCIDFIGGDIQVDNILNNNSTLNIGQSVLTNLNLLGSIINIGDSYSRINLMGNVAYIDTQQIQSYDNNIQLNYGGSDTSAIGGGISICGLSNITKANFNTDYNLDWIISSPNNKLTVNNIVASNISGLLNVNTDSANINSLIVRGLSSLRGDIMLGDSALDILTCNATTNFNGINNSGAITTNTLSTTTMTGTLTTSAQPNITSVGILNGLQVMGNNLLIGNIGTNLYVNNSSGKVGFGTGSTLSSSSKVEIVGGLKTDTLDITSFNPSSITTTTANIITANITTLNSTTLNNSGNVTLGTSSANNLTCNASSQFLGGIRYRNTGTYDKIYTATGNTTSGNRTFTTPAFMFSSLPIATVSCIVAEDNMRICWIRTATYSSTTGIATFIVRVVDTANGAVSGVPVNIICIGD